MATEPVNGGSDIESLYANGTPDEKRAIEEAMVGPFTFTLVKQISKWPEKVKEDG